MGTEDCRDAARAAWLPAMAAMAALAGLAIGCAHGIPPSPRAVAPGADRAPKEAALPAPRPGCYVALPGEDTHYVNEDGGSFDLGFATGVIVGRAPVDVAGQEKQRNFADGEIYIEAPPDGVKLRLRRPCASGCSARRRSGASRRWRRRRPRRRRRVRRSLRRKRAPGRAG